MIKSWQGTHTITDIFRDNDMWKKLVSHERTAAGDMNDIPFMSRSLWKSTYKIQVNKEQISNAKNEY